jgi:dihydrofolate reductase (trimethoprim resistance protein)
MQELPVQMHPRYNEFLAFMAECPYRKTPETMQAAFWAWHKTMSELCGHRWIETDKPFVFEKANTDTKNIISTKFEHGDRVKKKSGSEWQGHIVGWYSTGLTPEGYAVESESHAGSVQIYPESALRLVK